jgi:hypothetical protein
MPITEDGRGGSVAVLSPAVERYSLTVDVIFCSKILSLEFIEIEKSMGRISVNSIIADAMFEAAQNSRQK